MKTKDTRYEILGNLNDGLTENQFKQGQNQRPVVKSGELPKNFQWRTFHDTGRKTCCGGGFVRKFADGTNDWKKETGSPSIQRTLPALITEMNYMKHSKMKVLEKELSTKVWRRT